MEYRRRRPLWRGIEGPSRRAGALTPISCRIKLVGAMTSLNIKHSKALREMIAVKYLCVVVSLPEYRI